jgi:hypothetical protein
MPNLQGRHNRDLRKAEELATQFTNILRIYLITHKAQWYERRSEGS